MYLESMAPMGSALDSFSNLGWSNAGEKEENLSLNLARYWKEWGVSQMSSYVDSSFVRTYISYIVKNANDIRLSSNAWCGLNFSIFAHFFVFFFMTKIEKLGEIDGVKVLA